MVTYEGAKKLLKLCPKAVFHVDLDVSRVRLAYHFCRLIDDRSIGMETSKFEYDRLRSDVSLSNI
jgi:hypothetical protein